MLKMAILMALLITLLFTGCAPRFPVYVKTSPETQWKVAWMASEDDFASWSSTHVPLGEITSVNDLGISTRRELKGFVYGKGDTVFVFKSPSWLIDATRLSGKRTGPMTISEPGGHSISLVDSLDMGILTP